MNTQHDPVAWKPGSFARAIDKSRSWLYALPSGLQPKSIKVGYSRLITEHPNDFLQRLSLPQSQQVLRDHALAKARKAAR